MITQILTEQQKNVEQTDEAKKAYGEKTSALDTRTVGEQTNPQESDFKSVGGHMFADTANADRSNDRVRPVKAK